MFDVALLVILEHYAPLYVATFPGHCHHYWSSEDIDRSTWAFPQSLYEFQARMVLVLLISLDHKTPSGFETHQKQV